MKALLTNPVALVLYILFLTVFWFDLNSKQSKFNQVASVSMMVSSTIATSTLQATSTATSSQNAGVLATPTLVPSTNAKVGGWDSTKTVRPGGTLHSGVACADMITRSSFEPRPENTKANHTRGKSGVVIDGASDAYNKKYASRIDGNFVGTTDEILQWGSCKWGFPADLTRARAVKESSWRQSVAGDAGKSFGLLQIKRPVHEGTYPLSETSSAFNVDYANAWLRACYDGDFTWLEDDEYKAGDLWGCVGAWYSGEWYEKSENYIEETKEHMANRIWTVYKPR